MVSNISTYHIWLLCHLSGVFVFDMGGYNISNCWKEEKGDVSAPEQCGLQSTNGALECSDCVGVSVVWCRGQTVLSMLSPTILKACHSWLVSSQCVLSSVVWACTSSLAWISSSCENSELIDNTDDKGDILGAEMELASDTSRSWLNRCAVLDFVSEGYDWSRHQRSGCHRCHHKRSYYPLLVHSVPSRRHMHTYW